MKPDALFVLEREQMMTLYSGCFWAICMAACRPRPVVPPVMSTVLDGGAIVEYKGESWGSERQKCSFRAVCSFNVGESQGRLGLCAGRN